MKRILRVRLPERFRGPWLPRLIELAVGLGAPVIFVTLRLALQPLTGNSAPYALSFLAVVLACLVAGWRSGLLALIAGQALTWYLFGLSDDGRGFASLLLVTLSQLVILLVIALYQREVARTGAARERRIVFLSQALREIDHRTHNNFQTVLSLILLQANRAASPEVRAALHEAADRVKAVSLAYEKLALSAETLKAVRLQDHLHELCEQIGRGMVPDGIRLETDFAPATLPAEKAVCVGIIANELVTNALKHAFNGGGGTIAIATRLDGEAIELKVADDGKGMAKKGVKPGLGSRLVATFVRQLGARHEVSSSPGGTVHRIHIPAAA